VGRAPDRRSAMDGEAHVPLAGSVRLTGVYADPDPHVGIVRPLVRVERPLDGHGRRHRVRGAPEGDEERIALGVDHLTAIRGERLTKHHLVAR
jgi:hypothetical protein